MYMELTVSMTGSIFCSSWRAYMTEEFLSTAHHKCAHNRVRFSFLHVSLTGSSEERLGILIVAEAAVDVCLISNDQQIGFNCTKRLINRTTNFPKVGKGEENTSRNTLTKNERTSTCHVCPQVHWRVHAPWNPRCKSRVIVVESPWIQKLERQNLHFRDCCEKGVCLTASTNMSLARGEHGCRK